MQLRPLLLLAFALFSSIVAGCTCGSGSSPHLPDAALPDASRFDGSIPGRDGSTCDPITGEGCPCATAGETRSCAVAGGTGACGMGTQTCTVGLEFPAWGPCGDVPEPSAEACNGVDDDCDGMTDEGCPTTVTVGVMLDGDCVTARCPPEAPYPIGCDIMMAGDDSRGCVASSATSPVVYFQEGDRCGAGRVTGTLTCSSDPGAGLNEMNCHINKDVRYYPMDRSGCPAT